MNDKEFIRFIAIKVYNYIKKMGYDEQTMAVLWDSIAEEIGRRIEEDK
jgi:hypothetical protein